MKSNSYKSQQGFTIIEVLIVLAIAAVISMIVFLAVPTLQRSKRNYARKADVNIILSALYDKYNNDHSYPHSCNNGQSGCFFNTLDLSFYGSPPSGTKTVSFFNLADLNGSDCSWPGTGCGAHDPNLAVGVGGTDDFRTQFDDTNLVSVRSWAKCADDGSGNFTGAGARKLNIAAQYFTETATGGWTLHCVEG